MVGRDAQELRAVPGALRPRRAGRLRRDPAARARAAARHAGAAGALPAALRPAAGRRVPGRSEEHTSELQSLMRISYAVFCLTNTNTNPSLPSPHTPTPTH